MSHPDSLYDDSDDFYGEDIDARYEDDYEDGWDIDDYYMDGDHDSAMESAGWGMDEDYGYFGEDY